MSKGIPLDDQDRRPWLVALHDLISHHLSQGSPAVVTCSALKKDYRCLLAEGNAGLVFVYLKGDYDLIWRRMSAREDHYMKTSMLRSQFDDLEEPSAGKAQYIEITRPPDEIVDIIMEYLGTE